MKFLVVFDKFYIMYVYMFSYVCKKIVLYSYKYINIFIVN